MKHVLFEAVLVVATLSLWVIVATAADEAMRPAAHAAAAAVRS